MTLPCLAAIFLIFFARLPSEGGSGSSTNESVVVLIRRLGSQTFAERKAAIEALLSLVREDDTNLLHACISSFRSTDDPEIRENLREILTSAFEAQLEKKGRGFLGIRLEPIQYADVKGQPSLGIRVLAFLPGSAAEAAGIQQGDIITAVDDLDIGPMEDTSHFTCYIQSKPPGSCVTLSVVHGEGENPRKVEVRLGAIPQDVQQSMFLTDSEKKLLFKMWLNSKCPKISP